MPPPPSQQPSAARALAYVGIILSSGRRSPLSFAAQRAPGNQNGFSTALEAQPLCDKRRAKWLVLTKRLLPILLATAARALLPPRQHRISMRRAPPCQPKRRRTKAPNAAARTAPTRQPTALSASKELLFASERNKALCPHQHARAASSARVIDVEPPVSGVILHAVEQPKAMDADNSCSG